LWTLAQACLGLDIAPRVNKTIKTDTLDVLTKNAEDYRR